MRHPPLSQWFAATLDRDSTRMRQLRHCRQWIRFLRHCILRHPNPAVRYHCICQADQAPDGQFLALLVRIAGNPSQPPILRGLALEVMVACDVGQWRNRRARYRARRIVKGCLRDNDPNVRFWACYAAAQMWMRDTLPLLQGLRNDQGIGIMGWTVAYEAGEAIKRLTFDPDAWETSPHRLAHKYPVHWRERPTI